MTESSIAGKSIASVAESAPATAMAYAHVYVDQSLSTSEWKSKLGVHTAEAPRRDGGQRPPARTGRDHRPDAQ